MKISSKKVLKESAVCYKESFKSLATVSFFIMLSTIIIQVLSFSRKVLPQEALLKAWFSIVYIIAAIALAAIMPKLYLSMPVLANSLLDKQELSFTKAYRRTKGKYWIYTGLAFIISLLLLPGFVLVIKKVPFAASLISIYSTFVASFFYTMNPMIAIEPTTTNYIKKSVAMIKGNYWNIFALTLITATSLSFTTGVFTHLYQDLATARFIIGIVHSLLSFFINPFISLAHVIVYRQLSGKAPK